MKAKREELVGLLIEARRFDNETVRNATSMASWRRRLDKALEGEPGDVASERYDAPAKIDQRRFVREVKGLVDEAALIPRLRR